MLIEDEVMAKLLRRTYLESRCSVASYIVAECTGAEREAPVAVRSADAGAWRSVAVAVDGDGAVKWWTATRETV